MTLLRNIENDAENAFENINWMNVANTALHSGMESFKSTGSVESGLENGIEQGIANIGEQFCENL